MPKINARRATARQVDSALVIRALVSESGFGFDLVEAALDGVHGSIVNHVSNRVYYVLEGEGIVRLGDERIPVGAGDAVCIGRSKPHGIEGRLRYLVITSPPFDPAN